MGKISGYAALTAPAAGDLALVVDVNDTSMAATGTDKQITLANLLGLAVNAAGPAAKTGNYTLTLADIAPGASQVDYNSSSAGTYTIPAHATVAFPPGACFAVRQLGTGACTIAGAGSVTVSAGNAGGVVTGGQGKLVTVTQDPNTTDTWWVD
jgi:hypothetical protein